MKINKNRCDSCNKDIDETIDGFVIFPHEYHIKDSKRRKIKNQRLMLCENCYSDMIYWINNVLDFQFKLEDIEKKVNTLEDNITKSIKKQKSTKDNKTVDYTQVRFEIFLGFILLYSIFKLIGV